MARLDPATLDFLAGGGLLLTANRRQSRYLLARHAEAMVAAAKTVWPTPSILPLDAWLRATADESLARGRFPAHGILDEAAALWLWRETVAADPPPTLADPIDVATLARRAWIALKLHGGTLERLAAAAVTVDHRFLFGWAQRVEARLAELGTVDVALLRLHTEALVGIEPPVGVMFTGLDETAPAFTVVHAAFGRRARVLEPGWRATAGHCSILGAVDPANELSAAVAWLRHGLEGDPDSRFALIVPDLDARRGEVERRLARTLQPSLETAGGSGRDRCFDISLGTPLADRGLVGCALDLLRLGRERWPFERITRLLRARWIAGHSVEGEARLRLDARLRTRGPGDWSPGRLAAEARTHGCDQFADAVERHLAVLAAIDAPATLDVRVRQIGTVLERWGWPGRDPLDSDEFQAAEAWHAALSDLAALAPLAGRRSWAFALDELARHCQRPFQPERGLPRVLVQETLDDPGVPLDGLWVMGLAADAWPRPAVPEALLPVPLQRELQMAAPSPAARLAEARRIQHGWRTQAAALVLSWPQHRDDAAVPASALLPPDATTLPGVVPVIDRIVTAFDARAIEPAPPDVASPLDPGRARGGARVPQLQAQCPFRAFAELRLAARPLDEPAPGVPPPLRGTLLHDALRRLWSVLRNRAALAALDAAGRRALIERVVTEAAAAQQLAAIGVRAAAIEAEWQCRAVEQLLALDLARPDFEVVATEHEYRAELGGLPLTLKVDRVDRVDGHLLLVDYKTAGSQLPKSSQWSGARPDAPQLPLYAVTWPGEVAGIAFAIAGREGAELAAVAADSGYFGTPRSELGRFKYDEDGHTGHDWHAQLERWRGILARLVAEHAAGEATVKAKRPQSCRGCALPTLCRVRPEDTRADDDDTEEGDGYGG